MTTPASPPTTYEEWRVTGQPPDDLTSWLRWVLDQREAEARLLCSLAGVSGTYLRDLLAEVDAKRRILDEAERYSPELEHGDNGEWAFDSVQRLLALPFADRPGYREEWGPQ